ncbi:MAG TPA: threonine--tRNA ligase [Candidatus Limnocylindrales bacterium]|nr:threonine--tRNA ligase [Candidatus Limnocylindrales bacterium]
MAIDADEIAQDAAAALSSGTEDRLAAMRHSAAHMMAAAVLELFPEAKLGIGPAVKDGFYYDFDLPRPLTPADLEQIEAKMREQQAASLAFEHSKDLPRADAVAELEAKGQPFKVEIVNDLPEAEGPTVSFYQHGTFEDLCRGGHLGTTAELGAFKLLSTAGAYWRGDETRPMLQRIYGTAWDTQEELDKHLWRLEEAKKRDHRKLGRELDLFTFHPESPAAPFLHPRGMALWRALEDWSLQVRREAGFDEVRTPSLVRKELWETSGHWGNYQDNMFVLDDYDHVSGLKPMNCPEEILIYKTRSHSYRELPMRFADYSTLFRKERTGVLAGMFRVRQLTQDDSHVFCRDDQVDEELRLALSLVRKQYAPFGFEPRARLATRPEKRLGSDEFWERAEGRLRERLEEDGMAYELDEGGGAFYAPKIDIFIEDALGREWQMATIQADYQLPQRFDLEYRAADGGFERPVVIHYAIYGSFERFIGIIIEHYTGAFPFWLAPVQVMVVPIADRHLEYAESVRATLAGAGIRSAVDDRSERMQLKLRDAQEQKIPVMVVVGDRDAEAGAVSPRLRTGESSQGVPIDEFVADMQARDASRELWPSAAEADAPSINS